MADGGMMQLSGREKATIFLSILGTDTSSRILRYLPEELADLIASSVNHLPTPTPDALGEVLSDFRSYTALPPASNPVSGLKRAEPASAGIGSSFEGMSPRDIVEKSQAQALAFLLSEERPQIIAFVLLLLSQGKREEVLSHILTQRDIISDLLSSAKRSPISSKLEDKLLVYFSEKLK